jgi:hypothetical protein
MLYAGWQSSWQENRVLARLFRSGHTVRAAGLGCDPGHSAALSKGVC